MNTKNTSGHQKGRSQNAPAQTKRRSEQHMQTAQATETRQHSIGSHSTGGQRQCGRAPAAEQQLEMQKKSTRGRARTTKGRQLAHTRQSTNDKGQTTSAHATYKHHNETDKSQNRMKETRQQNARDDGAEENQRSSPTAHRAHGDRGRDPQQSAGRQQTTTGNNCGDNSRQRGSGDDNKTAMLTMDTNTDDNEAAATSKTEDRQRARARTYPIRTEEKCRQQKEGTRSRLPNREMKAECRQQCANSKARAA